MHDNFLLRDVAKVMRRHFRRQSDVLARVGGDEFTLLSRSHMSEALIFLQKFIETVSRQKIDIGLGLSEMKPADVDGLEQF